MSVYTNPHERTEAPKLLGFYMACIGRAKLLSRREEVDDWEKATVQELSARLGIPEKAGRRTQRSAERALRALFLSPGGYGSAPLEDVAV